MGYSFEWRGVTIADREFHMSSFPLRCGVSLIIGRNGTGKSTFLEVLSSTIACQRSGGMLHGTLIDLEDGEDEAAQELLFDVARNWAEENYVALDVLTSFAEACEFLDLSPADPPLVALARSRLFSGRHPSGKPDRPTVGSKPVRDNHIAEPSVGGVRRLSRFETVEAFGDVELVREDLMFTPEWVTPPARSYAIGQVPQLLETIKPMSDPEALLTDLWKIFGEDGFESVAARIAAAANKINKLLFESALTYSIHAAATSEAVGGARPLSWRSRLQTTNEGAVTPNTTHLYFWRLALAIADFDIRRNWAPAASSEPDRVPHAVVLLDEPERGLHPTAVQHLSRGLEELAKTHSVQFVAATHSPVLVDSRRCDLFLAHRYDQGISIKQVSPSLELFEQLGLTKSDLLMMARTLLFVEGQHDKVVFETLLGRDLERRGVRIMAVRGAAKMKHTLRADLLHFTDAPVVCVIDNLSSDLVGIWADAKARIKNTAQDRGQIASSLRDEIGALRGSLENSRQTEFEFVADLFSEAITIGAEDRVHLYPLTRSDILDYLPPTAFGFASTESWDDLRLKSGTGSSGTKFKNWVERKKGSDVFSNTRIEGAVNQVDCPDPELTNLINFIDVLPQA